MILLLNCYIIMLSAATTNMSLVTFAKHRANHNGNIHSKPVLDFRIKFVSPSFV